MTQGCGLRDRQLGHRVSPRCSPTAARTSRCGADARRWSTRSTPGCNADYLPEHRLPAGDPRPPTDPAEAAAGADIVVLAVPVADAARQPRRVGSRAARRRRASSR